MIFIGPFPKPIHGQSLATQNLYDFLSHEGLNIKSINTAGNYVKKLLMHFYALVIILLTKKSSTYISLNSNNGLVLNLILILAARLKKNKLFLHYHAYDHIRRKTITLKILAKFSGAKAFHIVLGEMMKNDLGECIGNNKKIIILNNSKLIQQEYDSEKESNYPVIRLGHLSNLTKEKGLITTIDTAIFLKNFFNIELYLAGPIVSDEINNEIIRAKHTLKDSLIYLGGVYGDEKNKFYQNIDFFIFPSQYKNEAEPLVVLESLAAGVPVIASDIGCISGDLDNKGGIALTIDEKFNQLIYEYLNEIYMKNLYKEKSIAAREQFLNLLNKSDNELKFLLENIREGESR